MTDSTRPVTGYPVQPNGTAYPYAAPPQAYYPPQPQNPNYYNNTNPYYSAERANFIRRIFSILIASVIITGTIVFIIWLVLRPTVPDFRVDSLQLTDFNLSQQQLVSGNWDLNLTVRNPNKKITLAFDQILAKILYKSGPLSETMVPPFGLRKRDQTAVRASFAAASSYVDKAVVNGINEDKGRGSVMFNVRLVARVRFRAGLWWARRRVIRVLCSNLGVGMAGNSSRGSLVGGAKQCRVGV